MRNYESKLVLALVIGAFAACNTTEPDPEPGDGTGGGMATSGGRGGGGSGGGGGDDPSGGRTTGGEDAGGASMGGGSSSDGGAVSAGAPSHGGSVGQAGELGSGGAAEAGATGDAGSFGEAGAGGSGGAASDNTLLRGPLVSDQEPLSVLAKYSTELPMNFPVFNRDGAGDYYIAGLDKGGARRLAATNGTTLKTVWSIALDTTYAAANLELGCVSTSIDGASVLVGASNPNGTTVGGREVFVVKVDKTGKQVWTNVWGTSGIDIVQATAIANNGGVVSAGTSTGQVPDNPAPVAKGMWVAWHELDGRRAFHKQYNNASVPSQVLIDTTITSIHVIGGSNWVKLDLSGVEQFRIDISSLVNAKATFSADEKSLYFWGLKRFEKYSTATGALERAWEFEGERKAIIERVEGIEWSGFGLGGSEHAKLAIGKTAFYITGIYTNIYRGGASPRPTTRLPFIGKYDMDGRRLWFNEISVAADGTHGVNVSVQGLVLDPDGNPVVGLFDNANAAADRRGYAVKLDANTGDLR